MIVWSGLEKQYVESIIGYRDLGIFTAHASNGACHTRTWKKISARNFQSPAFPLYNREGLNSYGGSDP